MTPRARSAALTEPSTSGTSVSASPGGRTVPERVLYSIIVAFAIASVAALTVAIPQSMLLVRLLRSGDEIAPYTLKTVAWTGTIGVAFAWRCIVFVDFTYFDQHYLGTIEDRWPIESAMAFLPTAAVIYGAVLYHRTVTFAPRGRA